jgi:hypothetical protein
VNIAAVRSDQQPPTASMSAVRKLCFAQHQLHEFLLPDIIENQRNTRSLEFFPWMSAAAFIMNTELRL